jgi:hypothetical protein
MIEDIRTKYKMEEIMASIPSDRGELFIGYRPATVPGKWQEHFHQAIEKQPGRHLYRTVFEVADGTTGGVVVEVVECASGQEAIDDLMDTLDDNQAAELRPGPKSLQPAAFSNPVQAPNALFFVRGNLRISIMAQSKDYDGVDEWLDLIQQDLNLEPEDTRGRFEIKPGKAEENVKRVIYDFPWKVGPEGWFKFVSKGASIERGDKPGELILGPSKAEVTVKGWVIERGRQSYMGEFKSSDGNR